LKALLSSPRSLRRSECVSSSAQAFYPEDPLIQCGTVFGGHVKANLSKEDSKRYCRQVIAFGREGQSKIEKTCVGIVGLGGIGSVVAQMLAYIGVQRYVLVDDDLVEMSNLNRLVGAVIEDAEKQVPKVAVTSRLIKSILPNPTIETCQSNLRSPEVLLTLSKEPNYLFGCVDNDGARLILTELAAAYELPLIDCGTGIIMKNDHVSDFGGHVVVATPGDFCLLCANEINLNIAKAELESPEEKRDRVAHGYGLCENEPAPSVISLNSLVASLAVTEFMMLATGMRPPLRKLTYHGLRGIVTHSKDESRSDCYICKSVAGKRDTANIHRYSHVGLPKDLPF